MIAGLFKEQNTIFINGKGFNVGNYTGDMLTIEKEPPQMPTPVTTEES